MVACGEVMRGQPETFAGLRRGTPFNRLPPVVWALSPTVTVCQDLPRLVTFSNESRRPACRRENLARCLLRSILLVGLRLWRIGISGRTEMRSVASNLSLEKEGEEPSDPVTVCHFDNEALRWGVLYVWLVTVRGDEHRRGRPPVGRFGDVEDPRRTALGAPLQGSAVCFVARLPGRCPGLRWCAPLVLKEETCGREFRRVGDPRRTESRRTEPNRGPKTTVLAWKPLGRRYLATTDDRF